MDLIRAILLEIEQHESLSTFVAIKAPGYSPDQIAYHLKLVKDAGFIDAGPSSKFQHTIAGNLTWSGHEFLDTARNETVWQKFKAEIKDRGASLPFELIQKLLIEIAAKHFGIGPH